MLDALLSFNLSEIIACCGVLVPFGLGVVAGIFAVAKLIEVLLSRFPGVTYCAILGLVAASPIAILMAMDYAGVTVMTVVASVITFVIGFAAAYKLGGE